MLWAMQRPFLPVITIVTDADGVEIGPGEELRLSAGIAATVVEDDGPTRIELRADGSGSTTPQTIVPQGSVLAAGPATMRFVIAAARSAALPISRIQIIPHATTAQGAGTDYARISIHEYGPAGTFVRDYGFDGHVFDTYSRNFTAMSTAIYADFDYTCPIGSTVVAVWTKTGSGADVLGATWVIT